MKKDQQENYTFKVADTRDEFQQIHRLNYQTFVEEIPQHERNPEGILVDKFHEQNTYFIAKKGDEVIGMLSVCDKRPFSLDSKLDNLDSYLPPYIKTMCEMRLFSIKPPYRGQAVFRGLFLHVVKHVLDNRYNAVLASGTLRQTKLYRHMGFVPFGPVVGTKEAPYQPMYLDMKCMNDITALGIEAAKRQAGK